MARRQITFASVRPTAGWTLTREGVNEDGHFVRVYTRQGEEVVKDLTTGKIKENNFNLVNHENTN